MNGLFIVFSVFLLIVCASKDPSAPGVTIVKPAQCSSDVDDTFSREEAWVCMMNIVDTNSDKRITGEEIEAAENKYIPAWKRWAMKAVSWFVEAIRVSHIMKDCDADQDGYVTLDDYASTHAMERCMPYMNPDKQWSEPSPALCYMKTFCDNAASILHRKVY